VIDFVLHENGDIRFAIAIEVAALKEGVDSPGDIDMELPGG
jgi:hypothetical protein